jgi:hypothetical protein
MLPAPEWAIGADDDLETRESPLAARQARVRDGIDFGPTDRSRRRRRTVAVGAALGALGMAAACGAAFVRTVGAPTHRLGAPPDAAATRTRPAPCPPAPPAPAADVDGDGCAEHVAVAGGTVTAGSARWSLGAPGDVVAVGDWDCRGGATPALLRPTTGDVFVFTSWAGRGRPVTVTPDRRVPGAVGLHAEKAGDGCDLLRVDMPAGPATTAEVAR